MVTFYGRELERLGVDVRLATEATVLDLSSYDNVLLATGTRAADAPNGAIDAVTMLADRALPDADDLAVFGDSETAMFAALWLAEQGKRVTLLSPAQDVGVDTNDMQRGYLAELLAAQACRPSPGQRRPSRAPSSGPENG